jgi:ABC-type multidrug transport system fused ATPase/permease subunit
MSDTSSKRIAFDDYRQLLQRYLASQRGAVSWMALLLLTSIGLQLVAPHMARSFIDAAQVRADESTLIQLAIVFIVVTFVQQAMKALATYWSERVAWTATNALRADLASHLVRLDLGFHTSRTPGELIERVDGDVNALAGFFSSFVVQLIGSALLLIGVLIAMFFVDVRLGLAFTVFAITAMTVLQRIRQFATPYWKADRESSASFYGYVGEVLTATEDIRSSGAEGFALQRFFEHLRAWKPIRLRAEVLSYGVWMTAIAAFTLGDAMAYGLGGGLYRANVISLGAVYLVIAYTAMLAEPIETIRVQLQDLQRADAAIARVRELLAIRSNLEDGTQDAPRGALPVEFYAVSFEYERSTAQGEGRNEPSTFVAGHSANIVLNDISFRIEAGRTLGLLGHTGSGKTTIARLLFRLYDPQHGEVRLGGMNLRQARLESLRARVGLVTQDVQLFEASLRDNITFFDSKISDAQLIAVLEKLGLETWLDRLPNGLDTSISGSNLSAGEAQLVALARVFIKAPGLVILDEASSRLDPATQMLLERALDRLLEGRTAIIIAHRLATLERAEDILIIDNGRIVEYGPRRQLLNDPYSRFHELHQTGLTEILA